MSAPDTSFESSPPRRLGRVILYCEAAIVFAFSGLIVGCAFMLSSYRKIYDEMLDGKPLPLLTEWILQSPAVMIGVGLMTGCGAIACLLAKSVKWAFCYLSALLLFASLFLLTLHWIMNLPLQLRILSP